MSDEIKTVPLPKWKLTLNSGQSYYVSEKVKNNLIEWTKDPDNVFAEVKVLEADDVKQVVEVIINLKNISSLELGYFA